MTQYNRRTIVRGAAWTVPVVAVASTAPAFAASTDAPKVVAVSACKTPGTGQNCKGYRFTVTLAVMPGYSWTVTLTAASIVYNSRKTALPNRPLEPSVFDVNVDQNRVTFLFCTEDNSADKFDLALTYTAQHSGGSVSTITGTYPVNITGNC